MKVTLQTQGGFPVCVPCEPGENLLALMRRAGIAVDAPCGGGGTCGKCRVRLLDGSLDSPPSRHSSPEDYAQGWRLACQSRVTADCTVLVTTCSTGIRTADTENLTALRQRLENTGISFQSPEHPGRLGCAIDIGTTTVTALLVDMETGKVLAKASRGNAQLPYGADVIERIIQQTRSGGKENLQNAIVKDTLIPLMAQLCNQVGVSCNRISRICIAANTTMNHLLLGVDADPIRKEPYTPAFFSHPGLFASQLDLPAHPQARVLLSPNVGSYVGGDITAGVLATGLWNEDGVSLLIDLGTNGELVLGGKDFLIGCACSAGPALEGGGISCGMRATDGAIEACRIGENREPELTVIGNQTPIGICGSGIIDIAAELFKQGIIDARGRFVGESERIRTDSYGCKRYVLWDAGKEVSVNEADLDNLIRTKAAIYAAMDTLLESVGMTAQDLRQVYVAGGIGSGINMDSAVKIGMLPAIDRKKFTYVGNTALAGAYAITLSDDAKAKTEEIASAMTYLDLSTFPGYMDAFVAACFLPHTDKSKFA